MKIEPVLRGLVKSVKIYIEGLKKYLAIKFGCCENTESVRELCAGIVMQICEVNFDISQRLSKCKYIEVQIDTCC